MKITTCTLLVFTMAALACNNQPGNTGKENDMHSMHSVNAAANYADSVNSGIIKEDTMKGSPHRVAMATISGNHVHIEYGSPGVKDRVIWGGLVGYDKVWVTGAHGATSVQFSKAVLIGDTLVPAAKYALFTIPGKEMWTVILNKNFDQHLADEYDENQDVVRLTVVPEESSMTPRLTYAVIPAADGSGLIQMKWEKITISVPFKVMN